MESPVINWEFLRISKALTFKLGDEPEVVHFIRTGFKEEVQTYHVVQEDAFELKPDGKDYLMTSVQIKEKFGIDIDKEFEERLHLEDIMSPEKVREIIKQSIVKDGSFYRFEYPSIVSDNDYQTKAYFYDELKNVSKEMGICIITASQRIDKLDYGHNNNDTKVN